MIEDPDFGIDPTDAALVLTERTRPALEAALDALRRVGSWERTEIERALNRALSEDLGLRQRHAFGPLRVACIGRRGEEPLFRTLEELGRERVTGRIAWALESAVGE